MKKLCEHFKRKLLSDKSLFFITYFYEFGEIKLKRK